MSKLKVVLVIFIFILLSSSVVAQIAVNWAPKSISIPTKWTSKVDAQKVLSEYPRPTIVRKSKWVNLNGLWDYCVVDTQQIVTDDLFTEKILVPFPLESSLSGVMRSLLPSQNLWYRRSFHFNKEYTQRRILLHFGAVDWKTTVYVNGKEVMQHIGGYNSFSCDITGFVKSGENSLLVKVYDPTDRGIGPHGKQVLAPANIYYTPTSGIWQTVWLEEVPDIHIENIRITPDIDKNQISLIVKVNSKNRSLGIVANVLNGSTGKGQVNSEILLKVPNARLWTPNDPYLYDLEIKIIDKSTGQIMDVVQTYFGMRKVSIGKDDKGYNRIFLNNKYLFNLGTLDQGFWPDGLYTAPTDSALAYDIRVIKAMGFNMIRKHIKIEPERWYYYADKLGMLVWQDFVNPNQSLPTGAKAEFERGIEETIGDLYNHPSIITWVVFNEKWGQFDQKRLTEKVKSADPSRLVNGHSGELLYVNKILRSPSPDAFISSDMTDVHSYPYPMLPPDLPGKIKVIGEFGGIGVPLDGQLWDDLTPGWGYQGVGTPDTLKREYSRMMDSIIALEKEGLSASVYTQPFDVESEQNGLITYNRSTIKLPLDTIRLLNDKLLHSERETLTFLPDPPMEALFAGDSYLKDIEYYKMGQRDSTLLRALAIKHYRHKENELKRKVLNEYFKITKLPLAEDNLRLLFALSTSVKDTGFNIVNNHISTVNRIYGKNAAESFLMRLIFNDEIKPLLQSGNVNWDSIEAAIVPKYGELAKERVVAAKVLYYNDKKDWNNFGKYYKRHFDKVLITGRNGLHINNMTWPIFLYVNDKEVLNTAIKIMEYNIQKFDRNVANSIDTYANLLYKVGRREEALTQEKKAMSISKDDAFKITYEKMLKNEKTWE